MDRVKDTNAMIKGMSPKVIEGTFAFVGQGQDAPAQDVLDAAIATFREAEGLSLILPLDVAQAHGFEIDLPMACITLQVHSALDGIGLTAAVSTALAQNQIACNVVAAFHHDHVFVPADAATRALTILQNL